MDYTERPSMDTEMKKKEEEDVQRESRENDLKREEYEEIIRPYTYLKTQTQGKGFRNRLIQIFNVYYQVDEKNLKVVEESIDILHNSSLLIDDVEDDGETRRGVECAHRVYGIAQTINAGNLMYFKALEKLMEVEVAEGRDKEEEEQLLRNRLTKIYMESMIKLHIGQGKEIYWRNSKRCPSEEEYMEMVIGKTGELFHLGVSILEAVSTSCEGGGEEGEVRACIKEYCDTLGMIYQIKNDIEDIVSGEAHDLSEGKYSLPLIHCIADKGWEMPSGGGNGSSDERERYAAEIVALGGVSYALERIRQLRACADGVATRIARCGNSRVENMGCQLGDILQVLT